MGLAYGWTRPHVIAGLSTLYTEERLAAPPVTSSMLCRWEHGDVAVSGEYGIALCWLYQATPRQLGLYRDAAWLTVTGRPAKYVAVDGDHTTPRNRHPMTTDDDAALAALRESIELALEVEGPAGGLLTREHLTEAVSYYACATRRSRPASWPGKYIAPAP